MNLFKGILSAGKAIFGIGTAKGADNVMTVAKGIGQYIDEQKFTNQEKAEVHSNVIIPAMQKFMDSTAGESTERSHTRRWLAIAIIRNWFALLWVSIVAFGIELVVELVTKQPSEHLFSAFVLGIATIAQLMYLVLGVGAFFFAAHINRDLPWANKIVGPKG